MSPIINKRISLRSERGQAMTELALILPVLALLLFGILQFGIVFHQYITVTDAVRAGARKAVVSRHDASPAATAETAVRSSADGLDAAKLAVSVSAPAGWDSGDDVKVCATYPYTIDLVGMVFKTGDLSSCTTERIE
jgi:Flp pilus assembly protein TadG